MQVRTRIAPSPTGSPHIGTAYQALFNRAFADKHGGSCILRIEDSDQVRSTAASEAAIYRALDWLGIHCDEGPRVGGDAGPYIVSQRTDTYKKYVDKLVKSGHAFYCFCAAERLAELRTEQQKAKQTPGYDGHCLGLSDSEVARRISAGEPHTIRLKVPREGACTFEDKIRGEIQVPWQQVDMQILQKSDGFPTYHLCATIDDHLMGVTHILRGEEWLSSVPKHQLIFDAFGWDFPDLYHLPLIRNPDQSKMSKRRNPTSTEYYRARGYLPEALLNYLALMGWSMPDEREIFSYAEFVEALDLRRITTRGPVFDVKKLDWLNGKYLREMNLVQYESRYSEWVAENRRMSNSLELVQQRADRFDQVVGQVDYLLGDRPELTVDDFEHKTLNSQDCADYLHLAKETLQTVDDWESTAIKSKLDGLAEKLEVNIRDFLFPLFVAVSGRKVALPLFDSIALLGMDLARSRLQSACDLLGGVSKKRAKKLEKRIF